MNTALAGKALTCLKKCRSSDDAVMSSVSAAVIACGFIVDAGQSLLLGLESRVFLGNTKPKPCISLA